MVVPCYIFIYYYSQEFNLIGSFYNHARPSSSRETEVILFYLHIQNWDKLTQNSQILQLVKGFQIPFHTLPVQKAPPLPLKMIEEDKMLVDKEIIEMLKKGTIEEVSPIPDQYLSTIFLVSENTQDIIRF